MLFIYLIAKQYCLINNHKIYYFIFYAICKYNTNKTQKY
jgi:hypothetical protein